jgi:xylulokinase
MGVDLGTSACKTVIFTLEGEKVSEAIKEYPVYHPEPRWAEQNPSEWWTGAADTIKGSLRKSGIEGEDISGLAVDSQREAVVPIGKNGEALYNSIIWLDNRTRPQTEKIRRLVNQEKVLSVTGLAIDPIYSASKILWLKENAPKVFEGTECFLCAKDYIIYKLTEEKVTDYSMASRTMLFDIKKKMWSRELCSDLEIPIEKLPPVKESSAVVGEVTSEASKMTLLPKGLPVINGGGDRPCECLGAGVTEYGNVNVGTGTGSVVEVPLHTPSVDVKGRVSCCCHVIPETWEYEAIITTTGASLRWFRDTFGHEEKMEAQKTNRDPYDLLTEKASKVNLGSDGLFFYPYLTGAFSPKFNDKARGVYFGINLSHSKGHFVRAILEGVAFQYLETFEILKDLGVDIQVVNMVGGEAKSDLWNQIKADISGKTILIPNIDDAAALGAVLLAGVGTKQYSNLHKAVEVVVKVKKIYTPNLENQKLYSKIHKDYKRAYSSIEKGYEIY